MCKFGPLVFDNFNLIFYPKKIIKFINRKLSFNFYLFADIAAFKTTDSDMIYQKQFPQQDSPSSWCSNNFEYLTPQSSPVNELNSAEDTIDIISTDRLQEPFLYSQDQVHDLPAEIAANLKMDTDSFMDSGYSNNTLITDGEQNIFQIYQNEDAETSIPCVSSFQNIYGPYEVKVIETNAADELNTPQIAQRNPFIFSLNPVQSQELNKDNTDLPEYYKQNTPLSCYEDSCTEDTLESENKFEEIFMENSSENTVSVDMKENNNNYLQQQNINLNKQITYKSKTIIAPVIMGKPLGPALRRSLRQKAPALKLRIEKCNEPVENVHTPEITDAILDMEAKIGNFDLISYLTDDVVSLKFLKFVCSKNIRGNNLSENYSSKKNPFFV